MVAFDSRKIPVRSVGPLFFVALLVGVAVSLLEWKAVPLMIGSVCAVWVLGMALRYPAYVLGGILGVLSTPVILYLSRLESSLLVGALIAPLLLGTLARVIRGRAVWLRNTAWGPIMAFLSLNIFALLLGILRGNRLHTALGDLYLPIEITLFFVVTVLWVRDEKQLRFVLLAVLLGATIRLIWELGLFLLGSQFPWETGQSRILLGGRLFTRPVDFLTLVQFPYACAYFLLAENRAVRFSAGVFGLLCLLLIVLSFSRTFWLATVVAILSLAGLVGNSRLNRRLLGGGLLLFIGGTSLLFLLGRIGPLAGTSVTGVLAERLSFTWTQLFSPENAVQTRRFHEVTQVMEAIRHTPIFGLGLGGTYTGTVGKSTATLDVTQLNYVHNFYAQTLLVSGVAGLFTLLCAGGIVICTVIRIHNRTPRSTALRPFLAGTLSMLIAVALAMLTLPLLTKSHAFAHIGSAIGACVALSYRTLREPLGR